MVRAARRRFATDGYRATTVRRIAADAGVNVALINRYFGSKDGLFEACMRRSYEEIDPQEIVAGGIDGLISRMAARVAGSPDPDEPLQFLLLLRSSGDEVADRIRRDTLEYFTRQLARAAGWDPDNGDDGLLQRAQIAIATMLGLVMLRTSAKVEPSASATPADLVEPLGDVIRALFGRS
ncbi:TetR family transcriptional regulator [Nakamurella sp. YIM 132087]|uniref:TetR family transcriptional regulator n=1 Tax=Nakamurella alba TaxID=2665158 RepID=A0A7K1FGC7_9ACTN|nr:TetR family transcriptional regulator [Nakamurella alba]